VCLAMGDSSAMQKGEDWTVTAAHAKRENQKREPCRRPFSTEARLTECERKEEGGKEETCFDGGIRLS
jgi:hypothetical protein